MSNFKTTPYIDLFETHARVQWDLFPDEINTAQTPENPIGGLLVPILRDGDCIKGLRRFATCTVHLHGRSHRENGEPSLIPNASVIASHHIVDNRRVVELSLGDYVVLEGRGLYQVVKGTLTNGGNEDWPKLIPQADRYYVDYDGGPGYAAWTIRDRDEDGGSAERVQVVKALGIVGSANLTPRSLHEANAVAALLNLWHAAASGTEGR